MHSDLARPSYSHRLISDLKLQDNVSPGALVDELAVALKHGVAWQQTAQVLRHRADSLDSADCYDAHMEMGMLLALRSDLLSDKRLTNNDSLR